MVQLGAYPAHTVPPVPQETANKFLVASMRSAFLVRANSENILLAVNRTQGRSPIRIPGMENGIMQLKVWMLVCVLGLVCSSRECVV